MVILYARVSTADQAERDLSIPAQFRALRALATSSNYQIAAEFKDVASGTTFRNRPGLMAALTYAAKHTDVEALLVHRIDRLARNTYHYLTIRARLRTSGVRVISFVEHFDEGPLGMLLENIMAAMSEFYSANLSMEVLKSIEERHARGIWPAGTPPLGYLLSNRCLVPDPARAPNIRYAFDRWSTGTVTTRELAEEVYRRGLVNANGKRISAKRWCELLKSPVYAGLLSFKGKLVPGKHEPLISLELRERSLAQFVRRRTEPHRTHAHEFPLRRQLLCPNCSRFLIGEVHTKRSGRVYRYYRCHGPTCRVIVNADVAESTRPAAANAAHAYSISLESAGC